MSEWRIVKRLTKARGGRLIKSFALDEETCAILDSKPNASEYIRELVKRDTEFVPIMDYTGERLLMSYCQRWLKCRQAGIRGSSIIEPLSVFPEWNELTAEEVENMKEFMKEQIKQGLEACKRQGTSTKMDEEAFLLLQTKPIEQMYNKFRQQWYREQAE